MTIEGRVNAGKLALINNSQERVNMGRCSLGDQGAKEVADLLKKNCVVKALNLENNQIGTTGGSFLAKALEINYSVQEIFLGGNSIGSGAEDAIATALYRNREFIERGEVLSEWDRQGEVDKVIRCIGKFRNQVPFFKSDSALAEFFSCENAAKRLGSSASSSSSSHVVAVDQNLPPLHHAALSGDLEKVQELAEKKEVLLKGDLIEKIKKRLGELAQQGREEDIEKFLEVQDFLQEALNDLLVTAEEEKKEDLAKQAVQAGARINLLEKSETFLKKEVDTSQQQLIALLNQVTNSNNPKDLKKLASFLDAQGGLNRIDTSIVPEK